MKKRRTDELEVNRWSGGTTTGFLIFPETANYADRDFLFRISSAVIEEETSVFTSLPNYDRILMVLEGTVELTRDNSGEMTTISLGELDQTHFSGKWKTSSNGKITDFNVIYRPSLIAALKLMNNSSLTVEAGTFLFFWCREGLAKISDEQIAEGFFIYGVLEKETSIACEGKGILVTVNGALS